MKDKLKAALKIFWGFIHMAITTALVMCDIYVGVKILIGLGQISGWAAIFAFIFSLIAIACGIRLISITGRIMFIGLKAERKVTDINNFNFVTCDEWEKERALNTEPVEPALIRGYIHFTDGTKAGVFSISPPRDDITYYNTICGKYKEVAYVPDDQLESDDPRWKCDWFKMNSDHIWEAVANVQSVEIFDEREEK